MREQATRINQPHSQRGELIGSLLIGALVIGTLAFVITGLPRIAATLLEHAA